MSLTDYQALQQKTKDEAEIFGCVLPPMVGASLDCQSTTHTAAQVHTLINDFNAQQGWVMTRDQVLIDASADVLFERDIIEGEWCSGDNSIKVKLLNGDTYQVTTMCLANEQSEQQAYSEQTLFLRNQLKSEQQDTVLYRLWWQLGSGEYQDRWQPVAQQFIGFAKHLIENKETSA